MTIAAALVAQALATGLLAPQLLLRARWPRRAPRLGILAWQACVLTVLSSSVLLAVTALLPVQRVSLDVGHIVHACPEVLRRRYQVFDGSVLHLLSLTVAAGVMVALALSTLRCARAVRHGRRRQRQLLDLLVRQRDSLHGAHVLEHDVPLAYCVPGGGGQGGGRVVVTTAALAALDERQLTAVLAHEHAHLDGRHDLVLFGADVAAGAFPWVRFFRHAKRELSLLIEMLADDESVRRSDRDSLASALVDLGQAPVPDGAVAANGDTVERVHRLLLALPAPARAQRIAVTAASTLLLLSPWLIALLPAWAARSGLCQ